MSITKQNPRTVWLGGRKVVVNDLAAKAAITPGMVIERTNDSGTLKFQAHSTAGGFGARIVALEPSMLNKGIDDAYSAGDLVEGAVLEPGATAYVLIASGENITQGGFLESNGDGSLRAYNAGTRMYQALESVNNSAGPSTARIRAEAL